jgi:predicted NUDIX family phosphoesterase
MKKLVFDKPPFVTSSNLVKTHWIKLSKLQCNLIFYSTLETWAFTINTYSPYW